MTPKKGKMKGRPMMLNKNGAYVLDTKRDRELNSTSNKDKEKDDFLSVVKQYFNQQPPGSAASPTPTVDPSSSVNVDSTITMDHVRGLMAKLSNE